MNTNMARPKKIRDMFPSLWRVSRRFWPHMRQHRRLMIVSLLALFAEIGFRILEPWPLKLIFDRIIPTAPAGGKSGIPVIDKLDPMILLTLSAIAIVAIVWLRALASYSNQVGFALVGNRVLTAVRGELYRHLHDLSLSFHTKAKSGDLIVRVISDVGLLKEVTVTAVLPLVANMLVLLGMVAIMFWLHWQLTLLALAIFPLCWIAGTRLSQRIRQVSRKQRKRQSALAATAAESLGAIKIVQAMSLGEIFNRSFSSQNQKSLKEGVKAKRLAANLERTVNVLIAVATALVVLYGARLVMRNALTPGDLLVILAYLKNAFKPVRNFAKYTARLAKASAASDRVLDILDRVPEVRDLPGAVPAPPLQGAIRFENVSFAYEAGRNALNEVELETRAEEQIALVGPSGSGKSTLVSLMIRLYDPVQGRVLIDGHDIRKYTLNSIRSQISMVLQDTLLFGTSVYNNIAYGFPEVTPEEIVAAARLANAHEFIEALPQGYDTELGERGATLSNGQRQRIAIARAAIRKAPIVILDEPTTGLDKESEQAVLEALRRLCQARTTFLIVHDLRLAASSDRIFYLDHGRILEQGTHEELMQANGRYSALYKLQSASRIHKEGSYVSAS
jgi:ATP-binding cassette subfamily B protein